MATKRDEDFYLKQVRALLDRADHPNTPPAEAASARAKAEQIMRDYRIEQEAALAIDPKAIEPEVTTIDVCESGAEFIQQYYDMLHWIARYAEIRIRASYVGGRVIARVVGYPSDLKYAEMLYTSARMVFTDHLEPEVKPELSDAENAYRLRRSGMERWKVAAKLWGSDPKDGAAHGKVAKLYAAECERRGEPVALSGRGVQASLYRTAYANGFVNELRNRLRRAQEGADSAGGAVSLHGRKERVDAAFYDLYPELRPMPAASRESGADEPAECAACKKAKTGKCRAHRPWKLTAAEVRQRSRQYYSDEARAGAAAGRDAAEQVQLNGAEPARRLDDRSAAERDVTNTIQGVLGS